MGGRSPPQWKIDRIRELWDQLNCKQIGERLGMWPSTVYNIGTKKLGLPKRDRSKWKRVEQEL